MESKLKFGLGLTLERVEEGEKTVWVIELTLIGAAIVWKI